MDLAKVGERLSSALAFAGVSQAEFSRLVGCSTANINRAVKGKQWPAPEMLEILAVGHRISPTWVLFGLGPMEIPSMGETPAAQSAHVLLSKLEGMGRPTYVARAQGYIEGLIAQAEMEADFESKGVA